MLIYSFLYGVALLISQALAKNLIECNPTNDTCPNNPALGTSYNFPLNSSSSVNKFFNVTAGYIRYGTGNADFTVAKKGESPTIQTKFYIMFGIVSVIMKAASGQGIISSIVLESDDLDEVDWNFLGGNGTHIESNYSGKGNTTSFDRAIYHQVPFDPRLNFHNYTIHWTSSKLEWWIDSNLVRTLPYMAANKGYSYPQTPMYVRLGIWAGGDKKNSPSTIEWAGGLTDYTKGPYIMEVQNTEITDFGSGKEYQWTDQSGSFESIRPIPGDSTASKIIHKLQEGPAPSLLERFLALPSTTKLAIYCGFAAVAALIFSAFTFVCYKSRRKGRRERAAYEARLDKERQEASQYNELPYKKDVSGWDTSSSQKPSYEKQIPIEQPQAPSNNIVSEENTITRIPPPVPKDDITVIRSNPRNQHPNINNHERPYVLRNKSFSSRNPSLYEKKNSS
ncbi:putative extracellular glycosidase [Erysiphe neolycopersici]|uniref:chitinase n=1 Tax=Erysiphe neolycopersici TaxID=212602 RepID=A0A420HP91_9PEZI|nr:putative extracellular glycosidase [Erysiphe neolycopersici]